MKAMEYCNSIEGKAETWLAAKASNAREANIFTMKSLYAQEENVAEEEALVVSTKASTRLCRSPLILHDGTQATEKVKLVSTYILLFW